MAALGHLDSHDLDGCPLCRLAEWATDELGDAEFCRDWARYEHARDLLAAIERTAAE